MQYRRLIMAALSACLAFAWTPVWGPAWAHDHMLPGGEAETPKPLSGSSVYNLESSWTTQDGASVRVGVLRGEPVVVAMVYTSCKDMCPAIVADMLWIEKHLPLEGPGGVRFALFSFDSVVDTPERLRSYAAEHGMEPGRWTLFHGDEDAVRELAAALGVRYRADGQGGFDHATVISLLDADGNIVFQQTGTQASPRELLTKLDGLVAARD
jgi:protein SCO1